MRDASPVIESAAAAPARVEARVVLQTRGLAKAFGPTR